MVLHTQFQDSFVDWIDFKAHISTHFDEIININHYSSFAWIKHCSSVAYYIMEFEDLSNKACGFSPNFHLQTFLAGLRKDLGCEVRSFKPSFLLDAKTLTKQYEDKFIPTRWQWSKGSLSKDKSTSDSNSPKQSLPNGVRHLGPKEQHNHHE